MQPSLATACTSPPTHASKSLDVAVSLLDIMVCPVFPNDWTVPVGYAETRPHDVVTQNNGVMGLLRCESADESFAKAA